MMAMDEKHETLAQELQRLVGEYQDDDAGDATKEEAWNMIADFAVDNAKALVAALSSVQPGEHGDKIYIASKTKHAERWRKIAETHPVSSTWIYEAGEGETSDFDDLWHRCLTEAAGSKALVIYREPDEVMKGAWIELGAAQAHGVPVHAVGIEEYTVSRYRGITHHRTMKDAVTAALKEPSRLPTPQPVEGREPVASIYEAAKAVARYRGEIAQVEAKLHDRQDYRFYMEPVDATLDEAVQAVEDSARFATPPLPAQGTVERTEAAEPWLGLHIEEREDDALIVAPHWNYGETCIARRPKLRSNEEWRPIAERIIAALASPPVDSDELKALRVALHEAKTLLADLRLGQSIHNERFPQNKIDGPLWNNIGKVVSRCEAALSSQESTNEQ